MSSKKGTASDAEVLQQIRELAAGISDDRTRRVVQNLTHAVALNPQPLPPAALRSALEAVALVEEALPPEDPGARRATGSRSVRAPLRPRPTEAESVWGVRSRRRRHRHGRPARRTVAAWGYLQTSTKPLGVLVPPKDNVGKRDPGPRRPL
jgi:hypothetical protein